MISVVEIKNTGVQGQGVAHSESGHVLFVPGTFPGDRVKVEYHPKKGRYVDASLVELIRPSTSRVSSPCVYFGECGGCDWLDWSYEAQLDAKEKTLQRTLERLGLVPVNYSKIVGAEKLSGFRERVQIRQQEGKVGFYRKRSHEVVDVESCWVAHPKINEAIAELRQSDSPVEKKVEIFLAEDGQVRSVVDSKHAALGFSQANRDQNERLKDLVVEQSKDGENVLELFCGDGNFSFALAPQIHRLLGIDGSRAAIATAQSKLLDNDAKLEFRVASIEPKLVKTLEFAYDTLLVDPPRNGMGGSLNNFIHSNLRSIVYVSCSPAAFSKDVRGVHSLGFDLSHIQAIDMFPHTRHLEFVATFLRR